MELILLEKVDKLGDLGQVVNVRPGFGRNFLLPQGKALPATPLNLARFEREKEQFEARQAEVLKTAQELSERVVEVQVVLQRTAGTSGKLFGSVTNSDIAGFFQENDVNLPRKVVEIVQPIRALGEHAVRLRLHPDVMPEITINVERAVR